MNNVTAIPWTDHVRVSPEALPLLDAIYDRLMRHAAREATPGDLDAAYSKRAAAVHEAGHAIVHYLLGNTIRLVRIFKRGSAWCGECLAGEDWVSGPETPVELLIRQAAILSAGWLNEVRVIGKPALCSSPDEVSVFILLGLQIGEKMNRDPRGTARSILTCVFAMLEHMDAASRDLERRLVVQRRLSGFEVRRVLTRHTKDAGPS